MKIRGKQIIGSKFRSSREKSFNAVNPATAAVMAPPFHEATREDVDSSAAAAANAFEIYRHGPLSQRADFMDLIGKNLMNCGSALVARAHEETALPLPRLEGELSRTVGQLELFSQQLRQGTFLDLRIDRAMPERKPVPRPDLRAMQVPLGPVAVFGASNFPLAFSTAGGDTASALAAGCPVVVKGHPSHPGTSELAGQAVMLAVEESGVPPGVFSLLQAKGTDLGRALVQHPAIKAVAFTGSLAGGRTLFNLACARPEPIPVYAEMGSVNPVFFLPQIVADKGELLAEALAESLTLGVGQFCTSPGLVFVVKDRSTRLFLNRLETCLAAKAPKVMLHEGIKKNYLSGVNSLAAVDGVKRHGEPAASLNGCLVSPTLLSCNLQDFLDNPLFSEEVFGPSVMIVLCGSVSEVMTAAISLRGQLTASVHGTEQDLDSFRELFYTLEQKAGRLIVNGFPTGVEVCAAMHHGGPYPATTDSRMTSVGTGAMKRFLRPVCYQNFPQELLPKPLRDQNQQNLWRLVDGTLECCSL